MNLQRKIIFNNCSVKQTLFLAKSLARLLKSGDTLLLFGDIGSGKTFFSRGLIQEMMKNQSVPIDEVPSPTFSIVQPYDALYPIVWHLDLYRLSHHDEIYELGLEEALEKGICLIEWPSKMGSNIPERNISISFDLDGFDDEKRSILIELNGNGWAHLSSSLMKSSSIIEDF